MSQVLSSEEFKEVWLNKLTEAQRKTRAEAAFKILRPIAKKNRVEMLHRHQDSAESGSMALSYFYETVKSIWEDADFALSLGRVRIRVYAYYPARTILESTFRIEHFQTPKQKKEIELSNLNT